MEQLYPYCTKLEKSIVIVLHIFGALDIFILFYDDQDPLSDD